MNIQTGLEGRYRFEAFRTDESGNEIPGSRRVLADWFKNLVTNAGLHSLCQTHTFYQLTRCRVGSGSNIPAESDVALAAQVAEVNAAGNNSIIRENGVNAHSPYYGWNRFTYRFNAGTVSGNLAEVGVAFQDGTLFSRALIRGPSGDPTTISVLPDETLDVVFEVRTYAPLQDAVRQMDIGGVQTAVTIRAAAVNAVSASPIIGAGWSNSDTYRNRYGVAASGGNNVSIVTSPNAIGDITGMPAVSGNARSYYASLTAPTNQGHTNVKCDALPYQDDFVARGRMILGLYQGNINGGIRSMLVQTIAGLYQIGFEPPVQKVPDKIFSLDFALAIGRHSP